MGNQFTRREFQLVIGKFTEKLQQFVKATNAAITLGKGDISAGTAEFQRFLAELSDEKIIQLAAYGSVGFQTGCTGTMEERAAFDHLIKQDRLLRNRSPLSEAVLDLRFEIGLRNRLTCHAGQNRG